MTYLRSVGVFGRAFFLPRSFFEVWFTGTFGRVGIQGGGGAHI